VLYSVIVHGLQVTVFANCQSANWWGEVGFLYASEVGTRHQSPENNTCLQ